MSQEVQSSKFKNKKFVDTEEAARILGVSREAIKKKFQRGKIEGQFVAGTKGGGKAGQVLMVWVDPPGLDNKDDDPFASVGGSPLRPAGDGDHNKAGGKGSSFKKRYRVNRGEPGCNIVTPFVNGEPVIEAQSEEAESSKLKAESSKLKAQSEEAQSSKLKVQSNLPAIIERPVPARCNRIANLRYALIEAIRKDLAKDHPTTLPLFKNGNGKPSRTKAIKKFLDIYNHGISHPDIFAILKKVSRATLYNWLRLYDQGGIEALAPQYRGPQGSDIAPAEKKFLLAKLLDQNRPTIGDSINKCKFLLGEASPSNPTRLRRWVNEFRRNNYDLWVLEREGEKALNDKCIPYAERDWRDLAVGEAVVADGHKLNFQVINPFTGTPRRAMMVLFWDWKSSYPLGWEIMLTESIQCVVAALRNAIITLGRFPKHALLDNGKAFRANIFTKNFRFQETEIPGVFDRLNIQPHFAMPYNPQSKPIERFFRTFNDWFEREMPSYTGASIPDKPARLIRNEKRARALSDDWVPTIPEAMELIFQWREYYIDQPLRARDGQRPRDLFEAEKGPGVDPFALHFLMMTCKPRTIHRNGITFNGWHWYHENLYGINDSVLMFYSYYDLSQVYIFTMRNGEPHEFLCAARPVEKVKPFAADSEFPEDMSAVQRVNAMKRKAVKTTKKLADMLQSQKQVYIDWNRSLRDRPEVADAIRMIEDKSPKVVNISPFIEGPLPEVQAPQIENNSKSPLSGPTFGSCWERYEWYLTQDPASLNSEDHDWIKWYEADPEFERMFGSESDQRRIVFLKSKRPNPGVNHEGSICPDQKRQAV